MESNRYKQVLNDDMMSDMAQVDEDDEQSYKLKHTVNQGKTFVPRLLNHT